MSSVNSLKLAFSNFEVPKKLQNFVVAKRGRVVVVFFRDNGTGVPPVPAVVPVAAATTGVCMEHVMDISSVAVLSKLHELITVAVIYTFDVVVLLMVWACAGGSMAAFVRTMLQTQRRHHRLRVFGGMTVNS
jgi:hypothetical protein